MEVTSFVVGVVALASLFSTCVQCFELFKAAESLEEEFEILLIKLDLEKTRLLIWGNVIGILKAPDEGRAPELEETDKTELIERCLKKIKSLLTDTANLEDQYGLKNSFDALESRVKGDNLVSANSMGTFKTSYKRFWVRFANGSMKHKFSSKTRWAIHDKAKFEGLIVHLREFIDGLNSIVLVSRQFQDQIIRNDIASILDISKLRLVQSACEGSYHSWSDMASEIIGASEMGTVDRRNVEEWIRDSEQVEAEDRAKPEGGLPPTQKRRDEVYLSDETSVYFVLTSPCPNAHVTKACSNDSLWDAIFDPENRITARASNWWTIGRLITETVRLADFYPALNSLTRRPLNQLDPLQRSACPVADFYIHCAPCACLVQTAISVSQDISSPLLRVTVRPDDRLRAECCYQTDRAERLSCIVKRIKQQEIDRWTMSGDITYLDRWWMERRLHELDTERTSYLSVAEQVFFEYLSTKKCAGILFMGELEDCLPLMDVTPFPKMARIPRETEIYQMKKREFPDDDETEFERIYLGTYTPKKSKPAKESTVNLPVQAKAVEPSVLDVARVENLIVSQTMSEAGGLDANYPIKP